MALAAPACKGSPPGAPRDAVEAFFAAVARGDCDAALGQLGQAYRAELDREGVGCAVLVEEMAAYPLEAVLDTRVDGRNAAAHLVRTRMQGRTQDVVIRVQAEDGRWKIFAL